MFGWIQRLLGIYRNVADYVARALIHDFALGINWALDHLFGHIRSAWHTYWYGAHMLWNGARYLSRETYGAFWQLAHFVIPRINRALYTLNKLAWRLYETNRTTMYGLHYADRRYSFSLVTNLFKYVILHVLAPLIALAARVTWYIVNRINPLWNLISHVDRLVAYIFWTFIAFVEHFAMDVARRTTRFFIAFMLHNLTTLLKILEDAIIASL